MQERNTLGQVIRAHRHRLGLTQQEVSAATGISAHSIGAIESGRVNAPRMFTVRLLADAFGLSGEARDALLAAAVAAAERSRVEGTAEPSGAAAVASRSGLSIPRQLPRDVAGFTARGDERARLDALLAGDGPKLCTISGAAGIGKTTLAVHWGHRNAGAFPGGQLYVDLRGFDACGAGLEPEAALRGLLSSLGVPPAQIPAGEASLASQAALFRSLLSGRRVLLVLDNARDATQVRPLLPAADGCFVIVTSRDRLGGLIATHGAVPVLLDLLSDAQARALLAARIGSDRVTAEPDAVGAILGACGGLPIALAIVAARATVYPELPLGAFAAELATPELALDSLTAGDEASDIRAVLSWSYQTLSPDAAVLFRRIGLHPGPALAVDAAASLLAASPRRARAVLAELVAAHLMDQRRDGRYTSHDLVRSYAMDLAGRLDSDDDRRAALLRLLDHYVHSGHAASIRWYPQRPPMSFDPPSDGVSTTVPADLPAAMSWFDAEYQAIRDAVPAAADAGLDRHAWQLAWTIAIYLHRQARWDELARTQTVALAAAERAADPVGVAYLHRALARTAIWQHRYPDARYHFTRAQELAVAADDIWAQAQLHLDVCVVADREANHELGLEHARQALELFKLTDNRPGQARAMNAIGWCLTMLGRAEEAVGHCEEAIVIHTELADRIGLAETWDSLGMTYQRLDRPDAAVDCCGRAADLYGEIGDAYHQADSLHRMGDACVASGDEPAARRAFTQALALFEQLGLDEAETLRRKLVRPSLYDDPQRP